MRNKKRKNRMWKIGTQQLKPAQGEPYKHVYKSILF